MAKASSKRIAQANAARLRQLKIGFAVSQLIHLASILIFGASRKAKFAYGLTTLISGAVAWSLHSLGSPTYDSRGALTNEGEDLNAPGLTSTMWDICYLTMGIHVLVAVIWRGFWVLFTAVPA